MRSISQNVSSAIQEPTDIQHFNAWRFDLEVFAGNNGIDNPEQFKGVDMYDVTKKPKNQAKGIDGLDFVDRMKVDKLYKYAHIQKLREFYNGEVVPSNL